MGFNEFDYFRHKVSAITGVDLNSYKGPLMERRLKTLMSRLGIDSYLAYARLLERDEARREEFKSWFTINVSEFFRNPDKFGELQNVFIPYLLKRSPSLKIWSAGTSNGSEAYSVAIILKEATPFGRHQILATDVDSEILEVARLGVYKERDLVNVSPERLKLFFEPHPDGYRVRETIRRMVTLREQDLLREEFETNLDLILCRNVVIYFTEPAKNEVFHKFSRSLKPGGILFVGATESIINPSQIDLEIVSPFFYRKIGGR
ncbi:MAG: protein-glutamate O-methyltransferase CheR [Firmicutes bacterium]|nr:protein-glutamate O-methyltransferase CheR [Bacillota bacterium]